MRVWCVMLALLASACAKKTAPEFYPLQADYDILTARDGDEAFTSASMERIAAGLEAIPARAAEYERARALLATIARERARIAAERAPRPQAPAVDVAPPPWPPVAAPQVDAGSDEDAGALEPYQGMPERAFLDAFGACVRSGPPAQLDGGLVPTHVVRKGLPACAPLDAAEGTTLYLFPGGVLWGRRVETTFVRDAGPPPPPPPPPAPAPPPDAGERILTIPGAPLPEGYKRDTDP